MQVITEGLLSQAQLETIAYASQAHDRLLPNGHRKGFFLGDGAGVGKGRQLAGLIKENWLQGRTKHIWLSSSVDLFSDAQRDLVRIILTRFRIKYNASSNFYVLG